MTSKYIGCRASQTDIDRLESAAKRAGITRSEWLRQQIRIGIGLESNTAEIATLLETLRRDLVTDLTALLQTIELETLDD